MTPGERASGRDLPGRAPLYGDGGPALRIYSERMREMTSEARQNASPVTESAHP